MRIIGGKDYYDGCAGFGIDPGIVFVRDGKFSADIGVHQSEFGPHIRDLRIKNQYIAGFWANYKHGIDRIGKSRKSTLTNIRGFEVVLAGKVYDGVVCETDHRDLHYFYSAEKLNDFLSEYDFEYSIRKFAIATYNKKEDDWFCSWECNKTDLLNRGIVNAISRTAFTPQHTPFDSKDSKSKWIINSDRLKNIGFGAVMDGYTVHQEIMMWVGTMKSQPENMIAITDNDVKVAKHGFDTWSFRKHPSQ